jgi:hypothetical protein
MLCLFRNLQVLLQRRRIPQLATSQCNIIKTQSNSHNLLDRTTTSFVHSTTISQRSVHNRSVLTTLAPFVSRSGTTQFPKRTFFYSKHSKAQDQPQGINPLIQPPHTSEKSHIPPSDSTPSKSTTSEGWFNKFFGGPSFKHSTRFIHLVFQNSPPNSK